MCLRVCDFVVMQVYMPIRESHGSGEAALEPWYIYLGLFKVVNAHTPNKREEKDGSETVSIQAHTRTYTHTHTQTQKC